MLVMRNPYLIGIMLFVVGVSAINTFLYFEQLELVEEQFEEITKRTQVFASLDAIVQATGGRFAVVPHGVHRDAPRV